MTIVFAFIVGCAVGFIVGLMGLFFLAVKVERLTAALSPFAAVGKTICHNWPGECRLRIDVRVDGSEYHAYHGTPESHLGLLPTLKQWREATDAMAAGQEDED